MKATKILIIVIALILAVNISYSFETNSSNFRNSPFIVSSGGDIVNSSTYKNYFTSGIIAGITNSSTYKNLLGFFYTWLLADGQACTTDNQCQGSFCCSNVCQSTSCPVAEAAAAAGGEGGAAGGGGGAGGVFIRVNKSEEIIRDFIIDPRSIKTKVKLGESAEEILTLTNTFSDAFAVSLKVENLNEYLSLSDDFFEQEPGESKEVRLNFIGKRVGVFIGEVIITLKDIEELIPTIEDVEISVPIILEVVSKIVLFDVQLDIPVEYAIIAPGDELRAQITLLNLGAPEKVDVFVTYFVKDLRGNIIFEESETFVVEEQLSYPKSFIIPDDAVLGNYVAIVEVRFADSFAVSSQLFEVAKEEILIKQVIARNITILLLLVLVLVGVLLLILYKFFPLKKKRK